MITYITLLAPAAWSALFNVAVGILIRLVNDVTITFGCTVGEPIIKLYESTVLPGDTETGHVIFVFVPATVV